ncbi:hypothetical protein [Photobacterium phosphoreum]|uniref:hypothetical protein n=1 Tax=Photobacterium phosphoreum TaxID=659 RepID=UPI000D16F020|nr:hypothetical protein [Photobacterium phosphoreum]PTB32381.1 hypothetical protein DAT36_11980 [Photobacterium phosphoreum]
MIEGLTAADYTITYQADERQVSVTWPAINQQQWLSNIQLQVGCIDKTHFNGRQLTFKAHHHLHFPPIILLCDQFITPLIRILP